MDIMSSIYAHARKERMRVIFPEATEEKILQAAAELQEKGLCIPQLLGVPQEIEAAAEACGAVIDNIDIIDATDELWLDNIINRYTSTNPLNSAKTMKRKSKDFLYIALMLEALNETDVTFAGMAHTTGDVIMAGQFVVGLKKGISTVSSVGVFKIPGFEGSEGELLGFGDSAVCANPTTDELASIAIAACDTLAGLLKWEPRCALLS
jgi:phosphate acetyltransferase